MQNFNPDTVGPTVESDERIPLDMHSVARAALGLRSWWLEYDVQGAPYTWRGDAANESAADTIARAELGHRCPGFDSTVATLTACLEA